MARRNLFVKDVVEALFEKRFGLRDGDSTDEDDEAILEALLFHLNLRKLTLLMKKILHIARRNLKMRNLASHLVMSKHQKVAGTKLRSLKKMNKARTKLRGLQNKVFLPLLMKNPVTALK